MWGKAVKKIFESLRSNTYRDSASSKPKYSPFLCLRAAVSVLPRRFPHLRSLLQKCRPWTLGKMPTGFCSTHRATLGHGQSEKKLYMKDDCNKLCSTKDV